MWKALWNQSTFLSALRKNLQLLLVSIQQLCSYQDCSQRIGNKKPASEDGNISKEKKETFLGDYYIPKTRLKVKNNFETIKILTYRSESIFETVKDSRL